MRNLLALVKSVYYYLESSYRMWQARRFQEDDLVYTTRADVKIAVYPGKKSAHDFVVKYQEPGKRERTPAHIHLIVEMYVKYAHSPTLTLQLRDHILKMFRQIQPVTSFPPALQYFRPEHVGPFQALDKVGEFTTEFMLVVTEFVAIQEKTNYPAGSLTERLYEDFGKKDRFSVIQKAVLRRMK
jgi:hypothetical protein